MSSGKLEIGVARWRIILVILEPVQVLLSPLAYIALIWLLLLHALRSGVWCLRIRLDDRQGSIAVLVQSLITVTCYNYQ